MILVVFLHSYNVVVNFKTATLHTENEVNLFIQNFITNGIARVAVPLFFLISGFLFFFKHDSSLQGTLTKYRRRFKSLVIPYLFWSVFGLLLFFALQNLPYAENFFRNEPVKDFSAAKLADTIFLNPIPYQFWFIKSLVVLVLVSPIIYFLTQKLKIGWVIIAALLWFFNFPYPIVLGFEFGLGLAFFSLGGFLALNRNNYLARFYPKAATVALILWLLFILVQTVLIDTVSLATYVALQKTSAALGVFAVWYFYDILFKEKTFDKKYFSIFSLSFFIFAFHEPILTIFKKGLIFLMGQKEFTPILVYFLAPIITILISMAVGAILRQRATSFYQLITGGR
ncbi:polysaccharide biosynthesis protein [Adhaeribacter aerolatus]|uniref:Polysaccharide biosynthesis protein n=1 Tax=Adhaeribacter aerolatus TaxID=670289 RepID=A0A512B601_9BACT|nr:acyltransferase [Adhaeribacter aerolatus]GEO07207.1 polysaccharide biosynthesis protein [Adhaeribacter aerolatus]